jgi:phosphohistidine phosphatase
MKTVFLLRHGKSDWEAGVEIDHDRPLAKRGRKAAVRMGRYLAALGEVPDRVISSSAVRAEETVRLAAEAGRWSSAIETTRSLYEASPEAVLKVVRGIQDASRSVLLVGHEPAWSALLAALVGGAQVSFPTAALARVDLPADTWSGIDFGTGTLVWLVTPKLLQQIGFDRSPGRGRKPEAGARGGL